MSYCNLLSTWIILEQLKSLKRVRRKGGGGTNCQKKAKGVTNFVGKPVEHAQKVVYFLSQEKRQRAWSSVNENHSF